MEWLCYSGRRGPEFIMKSDKREEVNKAIQKFLKDHNFTSYYWRVARNDLCTWIDVGSWSEFFYIFYTEEDKNKFLSDGDSVKYRN